MHTGIIATRLKHPVCFIEVKNCTSWTCMNLLFQLVSPTCEDVGVPCLKFPSLALTIHVFCAPRNLAPGHLQLPDALGRSGEKQEHQVVR